MSSSPTLAWILNLDVEQEWMQPGPWHRPQSIEAIVEAQSVRLRGNLVQPGQAIVGSEDVPPGTPCLAWSPTPWAHAEAKRHGLVLPPAPAAEVLRRVNHKQFVADHVPGFAGHRIDRTLWRAGEEMPWNLNAGGSWLLRRGFGAAGRGRIRVIETVGQAEATWIAASHRMGDLCLEPWVQVEAEYSTAGFIERDGGVEVALPRIQEVDRAGQWLASTAIERGDGRDMELLRSATRAAGTALHQAGYWGPYSLDGFRYLAADGSTAWQLLGDLNARFTMAWGLSFRAELRGDRLAAVRL